MELAKCRSLPVLRPRAPRRSDWTPPQKSVTGISKQCAAGRGKVFWDGVETFARNEQFDAKSRSTSGTPHRGTMDPHDSVQQTQESPEGAKQGVAEGPDMQLLADMGYKGPMFLSIMNRSKKHALLSAQAAGDVKQFRAALRGAQLHVGLDDPLVKRLRSILKDVDWGIRVCKQEWHNMLRISYVLSRMKGLDLGHKLWDNPVLAAARGKLMAYKVSELQDPSEDVRKSACDALAAMNKATSKLQDASMQNVPHPALQHASDLAACFGDGSFVVRKALICALIHLGENSTEAAIARLEDPESLSRRTACEFLEELDARAPLHSSLLAARLVDDAPDVRKAACLALKSFGVCGAAHASVVGRCLQDLHASVRRAACAALAAMGADAASPYIEDLGMLVSDGDRDVHAAARHALLGLGAEGAAALRVGEVRNLAAALAPSALKSESGQADRLKAIESLASMCKEGFGSAAEEGSANPAMEHLMSCLDDGDPEVRMATMAAVATMVDGDSGNNGGTIDEVADEQAGMAVVDVLEQCLEDENASVRLAAVGHMIATKVEGRKWRAMSHHIDDASQEVRSTIITALGDSGEAGFALQVAAVLGSACSPEEREVAEVALAKMGDAGTAAVSAAQIEDEDEDVRLAAIMKLAQLPMFQMAPAAKRERRQSAVHIKEASGVLSHWCDDAYDHHEDEEEIHRLQEESEAAHVFDNSEAVKRQRRRSVAQAEHDKEYQGELARQRELVQVKRGSVLQKKEELAKLMEDDRLRRAAFSAEFSRPKVPPQRRVKLPDAITDHTDHDQSKPHRARPIDEVGDDEVQFIEQAERTEGRKREEKTSFKRLSCYLGQDDRVDEERELFRITLTCLRGRLQDTVAKHREVACIALGSLNCDAEDVAEWVAPLLSDPEESVVAAARWCMRAIGGPGVDALNAHDRSAFGKLRGRIWRLIQKNIYWKALLYIESTAACETAFQVNSGHDADFESAKPVSFFGGSVTGKNGKLAVKQIDVADYMTNHMLASDSLASKLKADRHDLLLAKIEDETGLAASYSFKAGGLGREELKYEILSPSSGASSPSRPGSSASNAGPNGRSSSLASRSTAVPSRPTSSSEVRKR